jgi:hypothetical protein
MSFFPRCCGYIPVSRQALDESRLLGRSAGRFCTSEDDTYFFMSTNSLELNYLGFSLIYPVFSEIPLHLSSDFFLSENAHHFTALKHFSDLSRHDFDGVDRRRLGGIRNVENLALIRLKCKPG